MIRISYFKLSFFFGYQCLASRRTSDWGRDAGPPVLWLQREGELQARDARSDVGVLQRDVPCSQSPPQGLHELGGDQYSARDPLQHPWDHESGQDCWDQCPPVLSRPLIGMLNGWAWIHLYNLLGNTWFDLCFFFRCQCMRDDVRGPCSLYSKSEQRSSSEPGDAGHAPE